MTIDRFATKQAKRIAAIAALTYIIIQVFQAYAISHLPETQSLRDELLQGAASLNIWRVALLLLSFYGLIYVFLTICVENLKYRLTSTLFALIGLVSFCFIETCLRSIELFYFQLHLPALFQQSTDLSEQRRLLDIFSLFQMIQYALYFPLMFSQALGSAVLSLTFNTIHPTNYLITVAFGLNAIRLLGRILGMFLHINWFDSFSSVLYLPFVIVIFGLISIWLAITQKVDAIDISQSGA